MKTEELQKKVMLVRLKRHNLSTSARDDSTSREVRKLKGVKTSKGGAWKKRLYGDGYKPIQEIMSRIAKHHKMYTTPFDDEGYAMLRASVYEEYKDGLDLLSHQLDAALSSFIDNLDAHIDEDRKLLGDTFDASDYPSSDEIREKCYLEYHFQAMPSIDGLNIKAFSMTELQAEHEKRLQKVIDEATERPMVEMVKLTKHLAERLGDPKARFYDSAVENIRECVKSMGAINVTGNETVEAMAKELDELLDGIDDVNKIRKDPKFRSDQGKKALAVVDRISKMSGRSIIKD